MWCLLVVILKGFHLGWSCSHIPAVCNPFSTPVCVWGHSSLLERSWHCFGLSAQELSSPLISRMKGHMCGQGKSGTKQQNQNVRLYLCAGDPRGCRAPQISSPGEVCGLSSSEAMGYSDFWKPHWDLQDATWPWGTRNVKTGLRKRDLLDICIPETCCLATKPEWVGLYWIPHVFHDITACPHRKSKCFSQLRKEDNQTKTRQHPVSHCCH